jgi:hypothetical protein
LTTGERANIGCVPPQSWQFDFKARFEIHADCEPQDCQSCRSIGGTLGNHRGHRKSVFWNVRSNKRKTGITLITPRSGHCHTRMRNQAARCSSGETPSFDGVSPALFGPTEPHLMLISNAQMEAARRPRIAFLTQFCDALAMQKLDRAVRYCDFTHSALPDRVFCRARLVKRWTARVRFVET